MKSDLIKRYFPEISTEQEKQFSELEELYKSWNEKINVISRKDIDLLYERHVLHSLAIAKFISFKKGTKVLDLGTGGGFPGIPLAIYFPEVQFTLVDSIGKKIQVVQEVISALGLKNAKSYKARVEEDSGMYDFVVIRAVASLSELNTWMTGKISSRSINSIPNGMICLKGGELDEELQPFKSKVKVVSLNEYFDGEFFETKKLVYLPLKSS